MTTERDRVAVVTGGSYGIGRDFVAELSRRGYRTIVCARDSQKLAQLEHEIPGVETIACDMSDLDSVARFWPYDRHIARILGKGAAAVDAGIEAGPTRGNNVRRVLQASSGRVNVGGVCCSRCASECCKCCGREYVLHGMYSLLVPEYADATFARR